MQGLSVTYSVEESQVGIVIDTEGPRPDAASEMNGE